MEQPYRSDPREKSAQMLAEYSEEDRNVLEEISRQHIVQSIVASGRFWLLWLIIIRPAPKIMLVYRKSNWPITHTGTPVNVHHPSLIFPKRRWNTQT
jgi:hypothetical protein